MVKRVTTHKTTPVISMENIRLQEGSTAEYHATDLHIIEYE